MENIQAIIMAGGNDNKVKSKKSKLLQKIYGKTIIMRVTESVIKAGIKDITVVVGENEEEIKQELHDIVKYVKQQGEGTASAILSCKEIIDTQKQVLVLNANIPLIQSKTINEFIERAKENDLTILTALLNENAGYGRILRNNNKIEKIIEKDEITQEHDKIKEVNTGIYCFAGEILKKYIDEVKEGNITQIVELLNNKNKTVGSMLVEDNSEVLSMNNKIQLELLTKILRIRINTMHMQNGVTIEDSNSTYIYDDVEIGMDTVIHPNTTIKSGVIIGEDCEIGPNAYIREGCKLSDKVKIGSFVEIKKAIIGKGTKVPHLSYMGDCEIGQNCNIGCGTITCNYDGFNKSKTIIGNHSFIGSNTNLVAPVTLGDNTFVAAGSTITDDVPDDSLAIARQRQTNKQGWNKKD